MEENNLILIEQRSNEEFSVVKEAMDAAHCTAKAFIKAKPIEEALQSDDIELCISVLITHIQKYEKLINFLEPITGKRVIYQKDYYIDKSKFVIKQDLRFIRTIVYVDEAKNYGLQKLIEKRLKAVAQKYDETKERVE